MTVRLALSVFVKSLRSTYVIIYFLSMYRHASQAVLTASILHSIVLSVSLLWIPRRI